MKLYDVKRAPNPRRVRMFLAEKGADIPTVEVDVMGGANFLPEFLRISPRGLVPALELDDGRCLDESVAICRYLESCWPEPNLLGMDDFERARIESLQRHVEFDGLLPLSDHFRNSFPAFAERAVPGRPEKFAAIPELAERGKRRFAIFLDVMNDHLSRNAYFAGERFSIVDITAYCTIEFAKRVNTPIPEGHAHSLRWYQSVAGRPSTSA
jgi:glutathione S-transferase